jgi:acetyl esterase/lipase
MRFHFALVTLAILASGGSSHFSLAQEKADGIKLDKRAVPAPAGVSKELRRLISTRQIPPALPVPETRKAWLEMQRTQDANNATAARDLAKKLGATWKSIEVAGVPCFLVTPKKIGERFKDRWFVHLHGGAFVLNGGEGCLTEALWVADACQARVLSIDYRRPPVHPFPAAIEDAVAVWKAVIKKQDASATALFGTSAGGNLTLTTTLKLKQLGLPLPGALFAGTPATDLEKIGDTWYTLQGLDPLGRYDGFLRACFEAYVPSKDFSDPLMSPARGDVRGFPPTILISGTRDLLLSDTVRMHRALRKADVEADLHVYEGQSHADYISGAPVDAPESQDAQKEIARFFDKHLK